MKDTPTKSAKSTGETCCALSETALPPPSKGALPHAHFVGIGGIGMAGVAYLLKRLGWRVSGCDAAPNFLFPWLRENGIDTFDTHDPAHIDSLVPATDIVVRTPAVRDDAPEIRTARERGIPVHDRGRVLAALSAHFSTIAVCGTHGKTTTSCFLAQTLRTLAPDQTAWCIGGVAESLDNAVAFAPSSGSALKIANKESLFAIFRADPEEVSRADPEEVSEEGAETLAPTLVAEADESDGTLAHYRPRITVLTNLDFDHIEHFRDTAEFEDVFRSVIGRTETCVVYCADHPRAAHIVTEQTRIPAVSFGFDQNANFRAADIALHADRSEFTLNGTTRVTLPIAGRHNILNALAAIAAAHTLGHALPDIVAALSRCATLPARRFQRIPTRAPVTLISDYAHHPVEIAALVDMAKIPVARADSKRHCRPRARITAIFEPHRYSRTKTLLDQFPRAFAGIDTLVLAPVYAASEPPLEGGTSADLYAAFRRANALDATIPLPLLAPSLDAAARYVCATLREHDTILLIGAGTVNTLAPKIAAAHIPETSQRHCRPQEIVLSSYGTAAIVPNFENIRAHDQCGDAAHVIGGGTNTLIAPTGCHEKLVRLGGDAFNFIRRPQSSASGSALKIENKDSLFSILRADPEAVEVGAATPGAALLRYCEEHGLSGIEFMAGIPGTVGGWAAMNAGTRFGSFCDAVTSVVAVSPDGTEHEIPHDALHAAYRSCPGLAGKIALSLTLSLTQSTPDTVRENIRAYSQKRMNFAGLRTAGSVFKNHVTADGTSIPAGKILDEAGCKGLRVGGAYVTDRHANVIATAPGATASDVLALVLIMQNRARYHAGITLVPEIRILG